MKNIFDMDNKDVGKLAGIVQGTESKIGQLSYTQIQKCFESIPEVHHKDIEQAIQTRSTGKLGMIIMMAIYQQVQEEVKNEHS